MAREPKPNQTPSDQRNPARDASLREALRLSVMATAEIRRALGLADKGTPEQERANARLPQPTERDRLESISRLLAASLDAAKTAEAIYG